MITGTLKKLSILLLLVGCVQYSTAMELIEVTSTGDVDTLEQLLQGGADVRFQTEQGTTALHQAAFIGSLAMVRLLYEAGADVNAKNIWGTPLHFAAQRGHGALAQYLIARGADATLKTKDDRTVDDLIRMWHAKGSQEACS